MRNDRRDPRKTFENEERNDKMKLRSMYVKDCVRLNIREEPEGTATVIGTVNKDERVLVFTDFEHPEFYKIRVTADISGYAMKKYLAERI